MMNNVLEKAKKLLALRDRAGTRGEAEAAARALARMLDKHRITMAELQAQSGQVESIVADDETPLIEWRRAIAWRRALIDALCTHYGVAFWRAKRFTGFSRNGKRLYEHAVHLCGHPSDMTLVRYLFTWLSAELTRIGGIECAGRGYSFKNSWMLGFAEGINKQLNAARRDVAKEMGKAALAILERGQESTRVMEEEVKGLSTVGYVTQYRVGAYNAGQKRGLSHHLGNKLDAGNARALPAST